MHPQNKQNLMQGMISKKLILIGGGALIVFLIAVVLMLATNSSDPQTQMQRLSARFDSLQSVLDSGAKNVKNADLLKAQTDASILIRGDIARVNQAMVSAGLGKIEPSIAALEEDTATTETLEDAKLNGRFDDAYKKALSQKIESTMALMREVNDKTKNSSLKAALSTAYDHQNTILSQLAKL